MAGHAVPSDTSAVIEEMDSGRAYSRLFCSFKNLRLLQSWFLLTRMDPFAHPDWKMVLLRRPQKTNTNVQGSCCRCGTPVSRDGLAPTSPNTDLEEVGLPVWTRQIQTQGRPIWSIRSIRVYLRLRNPEDDDG